MRAEPANRGPMRGEAGLGSRKWDKSVAGQFFRFNAVGVFNTAVDFAVFSALAAAGVSPMLAQFAGYGCGMLNSYYWNRNWTFRSAAAESQEGGPAAGPEPAVFVRFLAFNTATLALSIALIDALTARFGWSAFAAKVVVTGFTVVLNFTGNRLWVFRADRGRRFGRKG